LYACGVPQLAHALDHQLGGAQVGRLDQQLGDRAGEGPLGGSAVVADDVVDQRVVQDAQVGEGVDEPADMVVGVLQEPGVDLHLPGQRRLEVVALGIPGRDLVVAGGQLGVLGDDPELLLAGEGLLPHRVPALVEPPPVLVGPLGWHMVGGMGGTGGEVHEQRLVRGHRLLLAGPQDRLVGHVVHEVVAVLGRPPRLDW
jgi:hypothetical protein